MASELLGAGWAVLAPFHETGGEYCLGSSLEESSLLDWVWDSLGPQTAQSRRYLCTLASNVGAVSQMVVIQGKAWDTMRKPGEKQIQRQLSRGPKAEWKAMDSTSPAKLVSKDSGSDP